MQIAGTLLIVCSVGAAFWWYERRSVLAAAILGVVAGLALTIQDRITELPLPGFGTIKAAAEQAIADAATVGKLKERVENQSATVDLVATQASAAKLLAQQAEEQTKRAGQRLEALDKAIGEANAALAQLRPEADFTQLVVSAQNDDREAFDKLEQLANDKSSPLAARAAQAWITVLNAHASGIYQSYIVPWKPGFDPSKLSLADLTQVFSSALAFQKPGLLKYIWGRKDIPELDRLDFLMHVIKTDPSLTAVEYAGRSFADGTKVKIKPVAVEVLSKWWDEHRQEFVGK